MKKYELCEGKGEPINPSDTLVMDNPVSGLSRLTHWDAAMQGNNRQVGVKRIRLECVECGRRLMASIHVCHDGCCVIFSMPPHKPKGWWKKRGKRE